MKADKIKKIILDSDYRYMILSRKVFKNTDDRKTIKKMYRYYFKKELDLDNPCSFNEKLQWLKLYDRQPNYTRLVDKYAVKEFVASRIGNEYIIPTLGIWDRFEDIDFNILPNQFVLKCTHDSGGLIICRDKTKFDLQRAKRVIKKSQKRNYYYWGREWPYKDVKPHIIAEKYMEDTETKELRDYKFFCFNGEVKALFIATDRQNPNEDTKFDFFDADFNHLPFRQGHPNAKVPPQKPVNFEKMKELAMILSKDIPHVRVDFYEVNGKIYFGEMTFYHFSGFTPFEPEEWDYKFGEWLKMPSKENK